MKPTLKFITALAILLFCITAKAQTRKEIPEAFKMKTGYIQNINYADRLIVVNFIEKDIISKEKVYVSDSTIIFDSGKNKLDLKDLKSSDEIKVEGMRYVVSEYSKAVKIILEKKKTENIKEGNIDNIKGDIIYVDGHKVKLEAGKTYKSKSPEYKKEVFKTANDFQLGHRADVSGDYTDPGYLEASTFSLYPSHKVTPSDKLADSIDLGLHKKYYPDWNDKKKRVKFLGQSIDSIGRIVNDELLQEYVSSISMSLIPKWMKDEGKKKFVFIVVENDAVNANVRANGLAFIYTGLLKSLDNEAQLAAIIGHEIAHNMYGHVATDLEARLKDTNSQKWKAMIADFFNAKDGQKVISPELFNAVTSIKYRAFSNFSVDMEMQADRVGLCLMAMANYNPAEAPLVWKKIYNSYAKPKAEKALKVAGKATEIKDKVVNNDTKGKNKNEALLSNAKVVGESLLEWRTEDNLATRDMTHPGEMERFKSLNHFVSLYWNDPDFLKQTVKNDVKYKQMIARLDKKPAKQKKSK